MRTGWVTFRVFLFYLASSTFCFARLIFCCAHLFLALCVIYKTERPALTHTPSDRLAGLHTDTKVYRYRYRPSECRPHGRTAFSSIPTAGRVGCSATWLHFRIATFVNFELWTVNCESSAFINYNTLTKNWKQKTENSPVAQKEWNI